jgi:two-component system, LuxR family, sensor kinase FixL
MKPELRHELWQATAQCLLGGLGLALLTAVCYRLHVNPTTVALLFLIVVVLVSLRGLLVPSALVAVMAFVCLDYFFTVPLSETGLNEWLDLLAPVTFLGTAGVVTRLMSKVQTSFHETRALRDELRLVVDTIPALVWSARPDGSRDFLSQRWLEYTGLSLEQGLGEGWADTFHPEDRARFLQEWDADAASGRPFEREARVRRANGEYHWLLIRAVPLRDGRGNIVKWYGTSTDIDDRKRAEEALREQAALLDLTHDTVFVRDTNDVITYWNRGAEELYGWTKVEAVGRVSHDLTQAVFPAPLAEIMAEVTRTGRWESELIHTRRDGTKVVVASRWSLQRDDQGRPGAILETNNDVSERRRAEDALLQARTELAHVTRVTTLGELAASIAHEINQPLAAIIADANACLHWLEGDRPDLDSVREALAAVVKDGDRAAEVITRIRGLLARASVAHGPCDLAGVIGEVLPLVRPELGRHGMILKMSLAPDLPPVRGDRIQLQQVLLNLLVNAVEASREVPPERRRLIVHSTVEYRDDGPWAVVGVEDGGVGFREPEAARLFEAFYTTKPGGLGMGLSISRSIIERHGGRLWATANADHGATFHFALPGMR